MHLCKDASSDSRDEEREGIRVREDSATAAQQGIFSGCEG